MGQNILILSITSDIGYNLAEYWCMAGHNVTGTYNKRSNICNELEERGVTLFQCDLSKVDSIDATASLICGKVKWNVAVFCAGTLEPIGPFLTCDFEEWIEAIDVNFLGQIRLLKNIMSARDLVDQAVPRVLFFAGGGTNNANDNFSAYTVSKIALIKMCELLDSEIPDTCFTILGPGWVRTKIHEEVFKAGKKAGTALAKTTEAFENDKFYPIGDLMRCCDWIINADPKLVGGRNFSAVHDPWEDDRIEQIGVDTNYFKLRRYGNDLYT